MLENRILLDSLKEKIISADEAASMIKENMVLGFSGFTSAGYAKKIPQAIAKQGTAKNLTVFAGASTGDELDGELARAGLLGRRYPFQSNSDSRNSINSGSTQYADLHLSLLPKTVRSGVFPKMDYAIVECCMVTEECGIVPTLTVGATNTFVDCAQKVILELNTAFPTDIYGLHDIPATQEGPLCLETPSDRIGFTYIPCSPEKIAGIVINDSLGETPTFKPVDEVSDRIAQHIITFLRNEQVAGRMPEGLFPMQSGVGTVANAVLAGLSDAGFEHLSMYTEVVQDSAIELVRNGVVDRISTTSISLSEQGLSDFFRDFNMLKNHIIIRPQDVSNHPAMIRRFNVIAMNTAIEADIYGNVNSTHILGTKMMNGIGGSGDFCRNAGVSIFMTPSVAKNGAISSIVPMVSHVDNTEHDVAVLVTEQGLADLRGKSPRERAELIIENCAHPDYRPMLREYYEHAKAVSPSQHTPHDLSQAFAMHTRFLNTGSMKQ